MKIIFCDLKFYWNLLKNYIFSDFQPTYIFNFICTHYYFLCKPVLTSNANSTSTVLKIIWNSYVSNKYNGTYLDIFQNRKANISMYSYIKNFFLKTQNLLTQYLWFTRRRQSVARLARKITSINGQMLRTGCQIYTGSYFII